MIVDALIGFCVGILRVLVELLPTWTPPAESGSFGTTAGGMVGMLSGYFPILTLAICLGVVFGVKILASVWQAVVSIYDRVPLMFSSCFATGPACRSRTCGRYGVRNS